MALTVEARKKKESHFAELIRKAQESADLAKKEIPPPVLSISDPVLQPIERDENENRHYIKSDKVVEINTGRSLTPTEEDRLSLQPRNNEMVWDPDQKRAIDLGLASSNFCIIGAAGYGKTTVAAEVMQEKLRSGKIAPLTRSTKYLSAGAPGAIVVSFPNKAVSNIKKRMPKEIQCLTIHKLLEFEPHFYDVQNADGDWIKTMRFEPARNAFNKLPSSISTIFVEEAATVSTELFGLLLEALPDPSAVQFIFLGDIQQLPPIYGPAILGFKMLECEVVELKTPHRQAEASRVLKFGWKILEGAPLTSKQIKEEFNKEGEFRLMTWQSIGKQRDNEHRKLLRIRQINAFINKFLESGEYNPMEDMILMPFNKGVGTLEINRHIADHLGKQRGAEVHEVIAGFRKFYFAIGDKVLVNKQEAIITEIKRNGLYSGKEPLSPSTKLNRWGHYELETKEDLTALQENQMSLEDMEMLLAQATASSGEVEDRKNQGSHVLHCKLIDSDDEIEVQTTGEFNECLFAYVLTIHKAQGSEWKKVLIFLDASHATMISRELLYTAITRARESLYIFAEEEHFHKGILQQRIKGNTLAEKAEFFKGKLEKED